MPSKRNASGVFSYSPNYDFIGLILNQAASSNNVTEAHKKLDNSRYSYMGRSYGVGSSVGLADQHHELSKNTTPGYNYRENGYLTGVSCIVNNTSNWKLYNRSPQTGKSTYPNMYLATGTLANGHGEGYAACGLGSSENITVLGGSSYNNSNGFSIAAGSMYSALDKVQCTVDFVSTTFLISVNRTELLIAVNPLENSTLETQPENMEPTGNLINITMRMPTSFSQQHACDLYTSLIGNTFSQNIQSANPDFLPNMSTSDPQVAAQVLRGVESSLASMLDNSLLAFSSAQLMYAGDTHSVPTFVSVDAVRIGKTIYIAIAAVINFTIVLLCLFEAIRTKGWEGLSRFDYTNIKSVAVGASKGGAKVAEEASKLQERKENGTADEVEIGRIKVQLEGEGEDVKLVGTGGVLGEGKGTRWLRRRYKAGIGDTELEALTRKDDASEWSVGEESHKGKREYRASISSQS